MKKEIFKDVKGYECYYSVSNFGRVFNKRQNKIMKLSLSRGYLIVYINKDLKGENKGVHQLVAESFLNHTPKDSKLVVNHINFKRDDNRVENLELVTVRENSNRKHLKSTSEYVGVYWNKQRRKWMASIHVNRKQKNLGSFSIEYDAHLAYQEALKNIKK